MEINTTARRYKLTPDVKEYAEKRVQRLTKYFDKIQEAHLVLAEEKYRQIAELTVSANGTELVSREETNDMNNSIDRVVERMEKQVKKFSARLKDRKSRKHVPAMSVVEEADLSEVETEEEFSPIVVRSAQYTKTPCTVEDAIRNLREKDWDFLLFPNARTGRMAVVYLRPDGNFGLVDPE